MANQTDGTLRFRTATRVLELIRMNCFAIATGSLWDPNGTDLQSWRDRFLSMNWTERDSVGLPTRDSVRWATHYIASNDDGQTDVWQNRI